MTKTCSVCQTTYEAQRPTSKYCGGTCRTKASRSAAATLPQTDAASGTYAAVLAELTRAGRHETYLGAAALSIASLMDESHAVVGYAALVKELRSTMEAALEGAAKAADPVDEVRARRDRKLAG